MTLNRRSGESVRLLDKLLFRREDLFAGTLTDPAHLSPSLHTHADEQLPWFEMLDNLPRYAQGSRGQTPMRYGPRETRK